jgi:hypothetical protein
MRNGFSVIIPPLFIEMEEQYERKKERVGEGERFFSLILLEVNLISKFRSRFTSKDVHNSPIMW